MPVVGIPSLLRTYTGGQDRVTVPGSTIGEIIDHLEELFPGIKARLCDADGLRRGLAVSVDTQLARLGLEEPVNENSEIHFIPAIGGGAC
jgi:molybdopterin synthase sulfur carrier subunit